MGNLSSALQQLRAERKQAQLQMEKLDQAISATESLNGSRAPQQANQPTRVISAASRRKMAQAQRARCSGGNIVGAARSGNSENIGADSCEAHYVGSRPQEDRGVSTSTMRRWSIAGLNPQMTTPPTA